MYLGFETHFCPLQKRQRSQQSTRICINKLTCIFNQRQLQCSIGTNLNAKKILKVCLGFETHFYLLQKLETHFFLFFFLYLTPRTSAGLSRPTFPGSPPFDFEVAFCPPLRVFGLINAQMSAFTVLMTPPNSTSTLQVLMPPTIKPKPSNLEVHVIRNSDDDAIPDVHLG